MRQQVITSHNNPTIKRLRSLKNPHARRKSATFLIEGPKLLRDALGAGIELVTLVMSESFKGDLPQTRPETKLLHVSEQLLGKISDTPSPQGLIAEAKRRWSKLSELTAAGVGKKHLLVAWGLQDPGNLGTMVRSGAAFGMRGLIVGGESADPFSPKAVRASAGTVLSHPLARAARLGKLTEALQKAGYLTYWTGPQAQAALREVAQESRLAVFIGPEGKGFSQEERAIIGRGLRVPIASHVDSLNAGVVGSIVAYELAKQI